MARTSDPSRMADSAIAYVATGKVHVRKNGVTKVMDSEFERTVRERAASIERRHGWKTQGRGAMFMRSAWAGTETAADTPTLMTGLTSGSDGALLYSMETDAVSGIFLISAEGVENRLFHTADFRIRHAVLHPEGTLLAATAFHNDSMRSNIAVLPVRGSDFSEVTEGESFDQFPRWVPGTKRTLVFQSAGVGRDAAGRFAGLGPCTIQQMDLDSGDLDEIAAEDGRDLLQPLAAANGTLYYIRKPYESGVPRPSVVGVIKDTFLFPFRLGRAVFQYFNVFSMMYTGKPLLTAKGAAQRRIDPRKAFIYGNLANAQLLQVATQDEAEGLVPSSWELMRRKPGRSADAIAKGVLTFDVVGDGNVVYSNGRSIRLLTPDGDARTLVDAELVEKVISLA